MRILTLNQDRGIGPERKKGAAVHVEAMREAFRRAGAEVVALDESDDARAEAALRAEIERGVDCVYERYALGKRLGSDLAHAGGIPHVVELNAPLAEEEAMYRGAVDAERLGGIERDVFARASAVLAVSSRVAEYARARGTRLERLLVRPNGVDPERFRPRAADDAVRARLVPAGRFALGFHGRLRPWHGIELLAEAFELLVADGLPVHLVLAGEGDFEAALGARVPQERRTRLAWVPQAEVAAVVAAFDALPLTYLPEGPTWFSPLKLAEGMACGVVPLFPPLGDLPALLRDGVTGLAYPAGDARALANAVRRLIEEPGLHARLGAGARAWAEAHSWEAIARDVLTLVGAEAEVR